MTTGQYVFLAFMAILNLVGLFGVWIVWKIVDRDLRKKDAR